MRKNIITDYTDSFINHLIRNSGEQNAKDLIFEKTEALLSKSKHMKEIVHGELEVKYIAEIYQKLSQKASPNTGGDEWLCSLFLRTHFLC